jgi:hypothetical protein
MIVLAPCVSHRIVYEFPQKRESAEGNAKPNRVPSKKAMS